MIHTKRRSIDGKKVALPVTRIGFADGGLGLGSGAQTVEAADEYTVVSIPN
jgi:hypothetical protein